MTQQIVVICILSILLWYYYMKSTECSDLTTQVKKLKTKVKYLESYKNDVSKTFKILNNELVLINEHIQTNDINLTNRNTNSFETNVTPNILNDLLLSQDSNTFNSMFNQFLTGGDLNFEASITKVDSEDEDENKDEVLMEDIEEDVVKKVTLDEEIKQLNNNYNKYLITKS